MSRTPTTPNTPRRQNNRRGRPNIRILLQQAPTPRREQQRRTARQNLGPAFDAVAGQNDMVAPAAPQRRRRTARQNLGPAFDAVAEPTLDRTGSPVDLFGPNSYFGRRNQRMIHDTNQIRNRNNRAESTPPYPGVTKGATYPRR